MLIPFLFTVFESFLFPANILSENQFNPASLYQEQFQINLSTEVKFSLSDLRTYTLYSEIKSYSLNIASFGNDLYRENVVGFGFGFPLIRNFAAGLHISLVNYWIKDYYSHYGYSLRIGGVFENSPIEIDGWINNINVPKFSDIDYLPLTYSVRCNLSFDFGVRGIETDLPFFKFGLFYAPIKIIKFGVGVNTEPLLLEYSLEIYLGELTLNYFGSNHHQLGLSHSLGVGFNL